jgi:hypothetical protein
MVANLSGVELFCQFHGFRGVWKEIVDLHNLQLAIAYCRRERTVVPLFYCLVSLFYFKTRFALALSRGR